MTYEFLFTELVLLGIFSIVHHLKKNKVKTMPSFQNMENLLLLATLNIIVTTKN